MKPGLKKIGKGRKVGCKGIDWQKRVHKFVIFRKNNEIAGLKRQEVLQLFVEKTKETMRFGTFKNLLIKVKELDKKYKNMICSVCRNTRFDLISDHVTIFSPSCKHDVCATCLGTIINIDEKVKLVLT